MNQLLRGLRGPVVALIALALSAGMAFADQPAGLANASDHAGKTVPAAAGDGQESAEPDEDTESDEDTENGLEADGGDHCATDPRTLSEEELAALNHGAIVCWAAHQTSWPEEFANHGAWVSSWAHGDHGKPASPGKANGKAKQE